MKNSISFRFNLLASALVIILLVSFGAYNQAQTGDALRANLDTQTDAVLGVWKPVCHLPYGILKPSR